jgi:hypothetical protein
MTSKIGFVYVLTNESMPGLVKIGFTLGRPTDRAKQLATTGVPTPFVVAYSIKLFDPDKWERRIHEHLAHHRKNKEWFSCDAGFAQTEISKVVPRDVAVAAEASEKDAIRTRVIALARETYQLEVDGWSVGNVRFQKVILPDTVRELYKRRTEQLASKTLRMSLFGDSRVFKALADEEKEALVAIPNMKLNFGPPPTQEEVIQIGLTSIEQGHGKFYISTRERWLGRMPDRQSEPSAKGTYFLSWWNSWEADRAKAILQYSNSLHPISRGILEWAISHFAWVKAVGFEKAKADGYVTGVGKFLQIRHSSNVQMLVDARLKNL